MRSLTLQVRSGLLVTAVVVVCAAVSLLVFGRLTHDALELELLETGFAIASTATELIVEDVIQGDALSTHRALFSVLEKSPHVAYFYVTGFDSGVVAHTFDGGFPRALLNPPGTQSLDGAHRYSMAGRPILEVSRPLIEGMQARLHVGLEEALLHEVVGSRARELAGWFLVVVTGAVLLGAWAVRRTTGPLRQLATSIAVYGREGGGELELPSRGGAEVTGLAESVRQMIYDRERATQELRQSERRFREMAVGIREVFWLMDWDEQRITYVNPAYETTWRRPAQDLYQDSNAWARSIHPDDRQRAAGLLESIADGGSGETAEYRIVRPDGEIRWIAERGFAVKDDQERVVRLGGISEDITERKLAEEQRRGAEAQMLRVQKLESLGVLAGSIAHDFNNVLTGVLGNADLALSKLSSSSPARAHIDDIETAALRAADLANQLLAYSGKGRFVIEPVDLSALIEEMAKLTEVSTTKKSVVRYDLQRGLPSIEADATQVRQIVLNLITNASEAIVDSSGVISISTGTMECDRAYLDRTFTPSEAQEGKYTFLEVSDTGVGMDDETQAKIFDPFFTTKFTGRGLGLASVLGIVSGHSGAISIDSEPGRGTTIRVLFPASEAALVASGQEETDAGAWHGSGLALLVDDEPTVRTVAKAMLERWGFEVLAAADGVEGLEIYRQRADDIAVILLDLTMPRMSGEETLRELRRIRGDVKVVLMSGYDEKDTSDRFAGKGAAGFVQKPLRMADLQERIQAALE